MPSVCEDSQFTAFMGSLDETPDPDPELVKKIYLDYMGGTVHVDDEYDVWWIYLPKNKGIHEDNKAVDIRLAVYAECGEPDNFDYICDAVRAIVDSGIKEK